MFKIKMDTAANVRQDFVVAIVKSVSKNASTLESNHLKPIVYQLDHVPELPLPQCQNESSCM